MKQIKTFYRFTILILFSLSFLATADAQSKQKFTISGYIEDATSGEKLISANAYDLKSENGTVSNIYGFYSITLPSDSVIITFSYIGYQALEYRLLLDKDIVINVELEPELSLQEITVTADKYEEKIEESTRMSTVDIPIAQIKKIPALLGEVDVLKALQLLPGVQSGGEGQNGLYVRGGSPDQNLILLDGVPVYNASHLFGFFSVFNADAVKDVKLTKGGFPARYGGRLSSVIEINMKEGNNNEWHGAGSVGIIASKLTIEGPIKKDKTSIMLSGRRTYIDILTRPLIRKQASDGEEVDGGYYFYDLNGKINHKFSDKDRLYFSVYTGKDRFYSTYKSEEDSGSEYYSDSNEFGLGWGNLTSALRWNHLWTNKLFSNTTLTFSRYSFNTKVGVSSESNSESDETSLSYLSGIDDVALKMDFDYVPSPNHFIRFGAGVINHTFKPGNFDVFYERKEFDATTESIDTVLGQSNINALEYSAYVEDDMKLGENLKLNGGLHLSAFSLKGKSYFSAQPRLNVRYMLPGNYALKASYASMRQYVQLLTNAGIGLPTDLWLPSTERVKPQDSWQIGLGLAKTFRGQYEVTLEGYYKEMKNLVAYKEGSSFITFDDWQDDVTQGDGKSYGAEFFVQKKKGKLTGWVGYTLSWSWRTFPEINLGQRYPFKYDRRHDISVLASYEISDRVNVSGAWVFGTGNAVTLANSQYYGVVPGVGFPNEFDFSYDRTEFYENRNNFRMRAYHRLDVGINFVKKKRRHTRTWSFGAYNTYNQKNPFFLFTSTESDGNTSETVLKQASLFPIIPYFNYSFEF